MASYRDYQPHKYDDFFTTEKSWIQISKIINKYIDPKLTISMPFYSPYSKCNELLGKYIKNKIIYQDEDFFNFDRGDIVIDNPPFSNKSDILKKLYERNKPFMLILPITSICYKYFRNIFKNDIDKITILIFNGRPLYNRCNPKTGELKGALRSPAFDSIVLCYKIQLPNNIMFLE